MKRSLGWLAGFAAVLSAFATLSASSGVGAGETSAVYVVHGLNLDGQTDAVDGGTNVTVCAGDSTLVADLEFGQVGGPLPIATGESLSVQVYEGGSVNCTTPGGAGVVIDRTVTSVPSGAVSLVATQGPDDDSPVLVPVGLDTGCVPDWIGPGPVGRLTLVHVADAGSLDLRYEYGAFLGADVLAFGESTQGDQFRGGPYGDLTLELGGVEFFVFERVHFPAIQNEIRYLVGNLPVDEESTPTVAMVHVIDLEQCREAGTTTTTSPSDPAQLSPSAVPVAAEPAFTG